MWDRPDLLNRCADLLVTAAVLLAIYGAAHFVVHLPLFPLREVRVASALTHVTSEDIEAMMKRGIQGNFFTLDLAATRAAFEKLPWIRKVEVRRHWPARLEVMLEEHAPLARWGNVALVNTHGEVFEAAYHEALPVFVGPAESAKEIAIQYEYFRRSLAAIGKTPVQVLLSPRRAWEVRLDGGPTLELGREQVEARLARFVAAYGRTLGRLERRIDYVDLRYANGFAVRIPEFRFEKTEPKRRRSP
jgi:cell division protein FtsQ